MRQVPRKGLRQSCEQRFRSSRIEAYLSPSLCLGLSLLLFSSPSGAAAQAQEADLLDASADRVVQRVFVPSPEQKVGEVRLIVRGDANVVQTLLYTKVLSRVVGEIRKKESANWPAERAHHADAARYLEALVHVQKTIWDRMPKDKQVADRRQRMLIELVLSARAAVVVVGAFDMTDAGGEVKVTRREPLARLDLSRDYVKQNMRLIAADSFRVENAALESLLAPLELIRGPSPASGAAP